MFKTTLRLICAFMCLVLVITIGGTFATWKYAATGAGTQASDFSITINDFIYGNFYITKIRVNDGSYSFATSDKLGDVDANFDLTLNSNAASSVTYAVSFYNNTDVSYYYDSTETVATNNTRIDYEVTGIEQKDEVPGKSSKTIYVTFSYKGNNFSNASLLSQLHFKFVVDKSSIGGIVAQTAVDRFRDILNNKVYEGSYQSLENGMNDRSGFNKASAVTYIGNVSGSNSSDSLLIEALFGEEFMSMDLDGDGNAEPITMMIKREDLDGSTETGDAYTYTNWGRETTVRGAEMTLYITSENLDNVSSGRSVVVYAAAFTKLPGATEWTDLVPLTKGAANANNYSGYGSANSFNTDTWKSDGGKTIEQLLPN